MKVGDIIKELRLDRNMSQKQLAKAAGYSQSMITRWEKNECEPTSSAIISLAKVFGCSTDYLLGISDN